jgi:hypothetical protein
MTPTRNNVAFDTYQSLTSHVIATYGTKTSETLLHSTPHTTPEIKNIEVSHSIPVSFTFDNSNKRIDSKIKIQGRTFTYSQLRQKLRSTLEKNISESPSKIQKIDIFRSVNILPTLPTQNKALTKPKEIFSTNNWVTIKLPKVKQGQKIDKIFDNVGHQ